MFSQKKLSQMFSKVNVNVKGLCQLFFKCKPIYWFPYDGNICRKNIHHSFQVLRVGYIFVLLILYGWAIIPVMYIFSFTFKVASTAYVLMVMFNVLTGLAMLLLVFILSIPSVNTLDIGNVLKKVFLPFPNYVLGQAVINI